MSLTALCLVLIAALLHAAWNLVAKKAGGDSRFALLCSLMILVLWAPVGIWAAWDAVPLWGWKEWALIFASGIAHLVYFNVLLRGYAASDLTVVYPVARGTGPLISSFGALLLLDEHMSLGGVLGVFAVTGGVFLIAGGPSLWARAHDPVQRQRVMAGLGYGAATGCMIALYTLIDGYSVKVMLISPILIDYFGNLARVPFMLPGALRRPEAFMASARALWRHALVLAVVSPFGYILVLYAARLAPLSHVAPAREVSMLFAALLGGRLLGEGERGTRIAGAACIAAGVVGLATG
jgi:drug/metabolite transporter (DMT)-like permease